MKRKIIEKLVEWKNSEYRKPLIIKGARQVGKTYILKEFGKQEYKDTAYFNFDRDSSLNDLFSITKDPRRIINNLSVACGKKIDEKTTLIIFDEIQECDSALNSLKYFFEEAKNYHIVCAGSLLGIALSKSTFPVGKVDYLNMYPMTYTEFLIACGYDNLVTYLDNINLKDYSPIPQMFFDQLMEQLKLYLLIGGMPEVVKNWVKTRDIKQVNKIQNQILMSYEDDFLKHVDNSRMASKVILIWNSIVSQLSKENKKFLYQAVKPGARAREYEDALNWINSINALNKVYNIKKPSFPLYAYEDISSFKIYILDTGILSKKAELDSKIILEKYKLFEEFKGALTENYIFNALNYVYDKNINYFTFDRHEIDFIIQQSNEIIPIEVKSGTTKSSISLTRYNEKYDNKISIRFSTRNYNKDGKVINVPLFMAEYVKKIIDIEIK